jgi:hypothetical protein
LDNDDLHDLITLGEEGLDALPYFHQVGAVLRVVRQRKLRAFLKGLGSAADRLSEDDRTAFEQYINSELGRELLADYLDTVIRARSTVAIAALAILFGDSQRREYENTFKEDAAFALDGISDRTIHAFLSMWESRAALQPRQDVSVLNDLIVADTPALQAPALNPDQWVATVQDLIARGILGPDIASGMRLSDDRWGCYFRFTRASEQIAALLERARIYLGLETPTSE